MKTQREKQIQHLNQHRQRFIEIWHRTPEQYMAEYAHIEGIYEGLCSDLEIEPEFTGFICYNCNNHQAGEPTEFLANADQPLCDACVEDL